MSFEQAEVLCGPAEIVWVKAPHARAAAFPQLSLTGTRASFSDNVVDGVWYTLGAESVSDVRLQHYLQLNAQGHQWTMLDAVTGKGWLTAHWIRDDGATATCGGTNGPNLNIVDPGSSESGVPDAPVTTASSAASNPSFDLERNVAVYVTKLGQPSTRNFGFMSPATVTLAFKHKESGNELMILVSFWHGVASHVMFSRLDEKPLSDGDIRYVLNLFSGGRQWKPESPTMPGVQQQWHRGGSVGAYVTEFEPQYNAMMVTTDEFWSEHMAIRSKASPHP